jgi:hypothetical protein
MNSPDIFQKRQNFVAKLQNLPTGTAPIGPETKISFHMYIYRPDITDIFWLLCGNTEDSLKLARVLPKRKEMAQYHLAKYRHLRVLGRVVKDIMRGQDVSQRACHQRVIAHEKSPKYL